MMQDSRIKETHSVSRTSLKKGGLDQKIGEILERLRKRGWKIGVIESCTGGAVANAITNVPGVSNVFDEGKVTYSVESKIRAGVRKEIIEKFGVYSAETAGEMACISRGEIGVGITGNLPGEVFVAVRIKDQVKSIKFKVESEKSNKIEARKEMKREVVERVVDVISDNF